MIVNNTQANVFKVNGGLADIFANRPAPNSSFFIFYSIDTQQIFYDNGAWVLIGSGAPSVNIYNSNGTLTGNRALNGNGFDLFFSNLDDIYFNSQSIGFRILNTNDSIITYKGGNEVGLKLDYANQVYQLGQINGGGNSTTLQINDAGAQIRTYFFGNAFPDGLDITSQFSKIGYTTIAQIGLQVNANANFIETSDINGINGLFFQYPVSLYEFGQITGGNLTKFAIDDTNQFIKTTYLSNDIGIKLDFANSIYLLGSDITNLVYHNTISNTGTTSTYFNTYGDSNGLYISSPDVINAEIDIVRLGDLLTTTNGTYLEIDVTNQIVKTKNQGNDIGLNLDFANQFYNFGDNVNLGAASIVIASGVISGNEASNGYNGIAIRPSDGQSLIGDWNYNLNNTHINIDVASQLIKTINQGNDIGLKLDFNNSIYEFGQITGGNTTYLTIDDAAAYPIQFDGTNITAGSSGSSSGQHLKVKINGTDYVIELKNP